MLASTLATKNDLDSKKDYKRLSSIMLTSDEWDLIQDLIPVLKPYAEATALLGGSNYCTHSMMNPILINIKKRFRPSSSRREGSGSCGSTSVLQSHYTDSSPALLN